MARRLLVAALIVGVSLLVVTVYLCHQHIHSLLHPPLALSHPVQSPAWGSSTFLCTSRASAQTLVPYCLHVASLPSTAASPRCHLLLIHGSCSHLAQYHTAAAALVATTGCHLHAVDLMGHGRTGGERGVFTLADWVKDVEMAASWIQKDWMASGSITKKGRGAPTPLPVLLLGSSQGGEVAYQALRHLPQSLISGAVVMGMWKSPEFVPSRLLSVLTHPLVLPFVLPVAAFITVPLPLFLSFPAALSVDSSITGRVLYASRMRDPLSQWGYNLASYLSLFLPLSLPPQPHSSLHGKHLLIICGEHDAVLPASYCEAAYDSLQAEGVGSVSLYVWPAGEHQLLLLDSVRFGLLIGSWVQGVSAEVQQGWRGERRQPEEGSTQWQPPADFPASAHLRNCTEEQCCTASAHEQL